MSSPALPLWRGRLLAFAGILLCAFSLRTAVASLSPLLTHIDADFAVPAVVVGLIGTVPPVCFALFGIITPRLEQRFGLERLAVVALAVVAAGIASRGFATSAPLLLVTTALVFAGVGVGNILLPPLVKKYFPDRIGLMTTLYSTTMAVATFTPPLIAVPVSDAIGWRITLGMWAVFAVAATIPWIMLLLRERAQAGGDDIETVGPKVFRRLVRLPLAWALTIGFAVSSTLVYTCFGWLPTILVDLAGVTATQAGVMLSLFAAMGLPCSLLVPLLVSRFRAIGLLFGVSVVTGLAGIAGLLFAPTAAPWVWVALLGTSPLLFPMTLVLLGLRTRSPHTAVSLSGFVQSVGYGIAAVFPFAIGLLHDATGGWTAPLWVLGAVIACAAPAGYVIARARTIEEQWESRRGAW